MIDCSEILFANLLEPEPNSSATLLDYMLDMANNIEFMVFQDVSMIEKLAISDRNPLSF